MEKAREKGGICLGSVLEDMTGMDLDPMWKAWTWSRRGSGVCAHHPARGWQRCGGR